MTTHPSDLALERLLKGEAGPPGTTAHLTACDACWSRWEHLHADEGWAPPARPALPTPANNNLWAPWAIAGACAGFALAASAMLLLRPAPTSAEVQQLQKQVETLRLELTETQGGAMPPIKRAKQGAQDPTKPPSVLDAPSGKPSGHHKHSPPGQQATSGSSPGTPQLDALERADLKTAVEEVLDQKSQQRLDEKLSVLDWHGEVIDQKIALITSEFVEQGALSREDAREVEALLIYERKETWVIKEDSMRGFLSSQDGTTDWKSLFAETNEALRSYLSEEELAELRAALNEK
jgi:hypothetical protein